MPSSNEIKYKNDYALVPVDQQLGAIIAATKDIQIATYLSLSHNTRKCDLSQFASTTIRPDNQNNASILQKIHLTSECGTAKQISLCKCN